METCGGHEHVLNRAGPRAVVRSAGVCVLALLGVRCGGEDATSTAVTPNAVVAEEALTIPSGALVVDDDKRQCRNAGFSSIQSAVDAASSGDTIFVCPGTYRETVRVTQTLTLLGAKHGKDGRKRTLTTSKESVVTSQRPFFLSANNIVLDGFKVITDLGDHPEGSGILTSSDFSGYQVLNNVVDADGVTALFPGSSGATQSVAVRNHFYNRFGLATSADEPPVFARDWLIDRNLFTDSSLGLFSGDDRDLVITNNKWEGRSQVTITDGATGVLLEKNKLLGELDPALLVSLGASNVQVLDNLMRDGQGNAIVVDDVGSGVTVEQNRIADYAGFGILLQSANVTVRDNEVEDNGGGIALRGAVGNTVASNNVEDNGGVGIDVDAASTGNSIMDNESRGNDPLDCQDGSTGAGTLGTANTWTGNEGSRSSPRGLCTDHP